MTDAATRTTAWMEALEGRLGGIVSSEVEDIEGHSRDEGYQHARRPARVVYARSKQDVLDTLAVARAYGVSVTPFVVGSSLEGAVLPEEGRISLDLSGMDDILSVEPESLSFTAEPGVTLSKMREALTPHGLFFSIDLGADASLGGMAGTNASGSNALRYGDMRAQVLAMEVMLADGRTIRLGSKARKSSSGYDLKDLLIGSEGILGIVTELTVRVHPLPAHRASLRAVFEEIGEAVEAATALARTGTGLARIELVDEVMMWAVNAYKEADHPERPTLWMEFHGSEAAVEHDLDTAEETLRETGAGEVAAARTGEEQGKLWEARNHAWYAAQEWHPDEHTFSTDICVPVGRLREAIEHVRGLTEARQIEAPILGHMGDGNFHVFFHAPVEDEEAWKSLDEILGEMTRKALELGGTSTGEHGVGLRKMKYQEAEHGEALSLMRQVKEIFDPLGLLNPGKVIPQIIPSTNREGTGGK